MILKEGDTIQYRPNPDLMIEPPINAEFRVIESRENIYIIEKPPNLPMHPAGRYREHTLLHLLRNQFPGEELSPLHRIDRETSGLVLFSRRQSTFALYQKLFEDRKIEKTYLAIVFGKFPSNLKGYGFLTKDRDSLIRKKMKWSANPDSTSLSADTDFELATYSQEKNLSLVRCFPRTGRIHQIRATLLALGYPIVGDKLYGKDETAFLDFAKNGDSSDFLKRVGHSRQALHAETLNFLDPISNENQSFSSPLPNDLANLMSLSN